MKKRTILLSLLLALFSLGIALAAGGGSDDPLVSLGYLTDIFTPSAEKSVQERVDASGNNIYEAVVAAWLEGEAAPAQPPAASAPSGFSSPAAGEFAAVWREERLKQGDILSGFTGTQVLLLEGGTSVQFSGGAVIDATAGAELSSGDALQPRHRYLVAEDTAAFFTVTSRTAVLDPCGRYYLTPSVNVPDYYAIADALKSLRLFKGSNTGYAGGFDLEREPTRIQALVMLIRLLGEEDAALACTSPSPFRDISDGNWARPYVAYAFERGYTNGVEEGRFAPDRTASMSMYVEFVLRALGYSSTGQTDISSAAARALSAGILTAGEKSALESAAFLRADIAYLSWYALEALLPDGTQTLHQKLEAAGVFSAADYRNAGSQIVSARL